MSELNHTLDGGAVDMAPACTSAITRMGENFFRVNPISRDGMDYHQPLPIYELQVFSHLTEFVKPKPKEARPTDDELRYDTSDNVPHARRTKRIQRKNGMTYQRFEEPEAYEKRIYPGHQKHGSVVPSKRGIVRGMSKKASINLRKRTAQSGRLDLWLDFTYSDDVMENKSIRERVKFSNYCKDEITRFIKNKFKLHLIWKREWQERKSGKLAGEKIPHFHVFFGGMSDKQLSIWKAISIQILLRWVEITGTDNPDAWEVAVNKKSYRKIQNPKHAITYISKYFAKDQPLDLPEGESIGRCWGYSKNCPKEEPWTLTLTDAETVKLIRHMIRKKKLNKTPKGSFLKMQLQNGFPTFLFEDKADLIRYLDFIDAITIDGLGVIPF